MQKKQDPLKHSMLGMSFKQGAFQANFQFIPYTKKHLKKKRLAKEQLVNMRKRKNKKVTAEEALYHKGRAMFLEFRRLTWTWDKESMDKATAKAIMKDFRVAKRMNVEVDGDEAVN